MRFLPEYQRYVRRLDPASIVGLGERRRCRLECELDMSLKHVNKDTRAGFVIIPSALGFHGNEHNPELRIFDEHFCLVACFLFR